MAAWSIGEACTLYNLPGWSEGYFGIGENGELITIAREGTRLSLVQLAREAQQIGLRLPILFRFNHILRERVDRLCDAFIRAKDSRNYSGHHIALYPIKVNQQRHVIEEIYRHGGARVGLEAGSKPELMAVLALSQPGGIVVCNGYKDHEYLRLALLGQELGQRVYIVIEKPGEAEAVITVSRQMNIRPYLGLRVRLASIGNGKWQNSGGERGKFGLSAAQTMQVVERLRAADLLGQLELLHFHMGSQIANVRDIQRGVREAARFYAELRRLGAPLKITDVGGGLGVDYEGSRTRHECSMNYSIDEYADTVVRTLHEICVEEGQPHPDIFTESGRAMSAHHAVLVTNVIDVERIADHAIIPATTSKPSPIIIRELSMLAQQTGSKPASEIYHEAAYWLSEAHGMYAHGLLTLHERAIVENFYISICSDLCAHLNSATEQAEEILATLNERLADKLFCNFSIFQSTPDIWGIDQIFPVVPLQRLNEKPTRRGILQDLTCDSDGQIENYVVAGGLQRSLPVHAWQSDEPYLFGIFMVGAYQEILGDLHNLFGDTDAVNVELKPDGSHRLLQPEPGDTAAELLQYVHFDPEELQRLFRQKAKYLSPEYAKQVLAKLEAGLHGYTYLEE